MLTLASNLLPNQLPHSDAYLCNKDLHLICEKPTINNNITKRRTAHNHNHQQPKTKTREKQPASQCSNCNMQSSSSLLALLLLSVVAVVATSSSSPSSTHKLRQTQPSSTYYHHQRQTSEEYEKEEQYQILPSSAILDRLQQLVADYPNFATLTTTQEWFGLPRAGKYIFCMGG